MVRAEPCSMIRTSISPVARFVRYWLMTQVVNGSQGRINAGSDHLDQSTGSGSCFFPYNTKPRLTSYPNKKETRTSKTDGNVFKG